MRARVLSGMRPTGALHLGHYHGALKNWVRLQHEYDSFFFVADWHALTTHYQDRDVIERNVYDMVIDFVERPILEVVMARAGGNQSQAAQMLGMTRNTLRKKLVAHKMLDQ